MIRLSDDIAFVVNATYILNVVNKSDDLASDTWLEDNNIIADYDGLFVENEETLTMVNMKFNATVKERVELFWQIQHFNFNKIQIT